MTHDLKTEVPGVLYIKRANGKSAPVVFDSPHSGADYPEDFDCIAPMEVVRKSEDAFVDELYANVPDFGASLQAALFPRAYIDPNRSLMDIDPELIDEPWPEPLAPSEKTRLGHGLIWRLCPPDYALYDRKLRTIEVRSRIETYWLPYHHALRDMLDNAQSRFSQVWHINCHSFSSLPYLIIGRIYLHKITLILLLHRMLPYIIPFIFPIFFRKILQSGRKKLLTTVNYI